MKSPNDSILVPWYGRCPQCDKQLPVVYARVPWLYDRDGFPVEIARMQINSECCGSITHLKQRGNER
jgi:hypothetical protein